MTIEKLHCLQLRHISEQLQGGQFLSSAQTSHLYTLDLYYFQIALKKASMAPQNKGTPSASLAHIGNKDTLSL